MSFENGLGNYDDNSKQTALNSHKEKTPPTSPSYNEKEKKLINSNKGETNNYDIKGKESFELPKDIHERLGTQFEEFCDKLKVEDSSFLREIFRKNNKKHLMRYSHRTGGSSFNKYLNEYKKNPSIKNLQNLRKKIFYDYFRHQLVDNNNIKKRLKKFFNGNFETNVIYKKFLASLEGNINIEQMRKLYHKEINKLPDNQKNIFEEIMGSYDILEIQGSDIKITTSYFMNLSEEKQQQYAKSFAITGYQFEIPDDKNNDEHSNQYKEKFGFMINQEKSKIEDYLNEREQFYIIHTDLNSIYSNTDQEQEYDYESNIKESNNGGDLVRNNNINIPTKFDKTNIELTNEDKTNALNKTISALYNSLGNNVNISYDMFYNFFDFTSFSVNQSNFNTFKQHYSAIVGEDNIKAVESVLRNFNQIFEGNQSIVLENKEKNTYCINDESKKDITGAIIDNISNLLNNIGKNLGLGNIESGFQIPEGKDQLTLNDGKMMIKGTLNGEKVNITYDYQSGDLYINSFIKSEGEKLIINDDSADFKVGSIGSFDSILEKYRIIESEYEQKSENINYDKFNSENINSNKFQENLKQIPNQEKFTYIKSNPDGGNKKSFFNDINTIYKKTEDTLKKQCTMKIRDSKLSNKLNNKIKTNKTKQDVIINELKNKVIINKLDNFQSSIEMELSEKSTKNAVISNFMKTFNYLGNGNDSKLMLESDSSKEFSVFNLMNILNNSESKDLQKFSEFMSEICSLTGISRGVNNEYQNKTASDNVKILFGGDCKNDAFLANIANVLGNFNQESAGIKNKDYKQDLGIVKFIKENIVSENNGLKIDSLLMEKTIKEFHNKIQMIKKEKDAINYLEDALDGI